MAWTVTSLLFLPIVLYVFAWPYYGRLQYSPQAGDIVFQSLPHSPLVNAIEGDTGSPYSHCGIVAREDGRWVVYEAYTKVERTPLNEFLQRGRNYAFAVYRLKPEYRDKVPRLLAETLRQVGRPYDTRYRFDDDAIYCSELVFKAFQNATGEELGQVVKLGDLRWKRFRETIERIEGGPVPLERQMITPTHISHLTPHTLARDLRQTHKRQGSGRSTCQADRGTRWVTRKTTICGSVLTAG
jgi:hypothetical protein